MAERILLIDDDTELLKLAGLLLENRGYQISVATLSKEGLQKARDEDIDLVLLDIGMPDINGIEVCRQLRAAAATSELAIIMFTSSKDPESRVHAFEAGADDYISKPVDSEELVTRVKAQLVRRERRAAGVEPAKKGKVLAFIGAKGGVGTTTAAANIAVGLARGTDKKRDVLLAEMRSGLGILAVTLGLDEARGIGALLRMEPEEISAEPISEQLQEHQPGVKVLCAERKPPGIAAPLGAEHARLIIESLQTMGEYVVADMGTELEFPTLAVLEMAHHVVLTLTPDAAALGLAESLLAAMTETAGLEADQISLLLMHREGYGPTATQESIERQLGRRAAGRIPQAAQLAAEAAMRQTTMVVHSPTSAVGHQWDLAARYLASL